MQISRGVFWIEFIAPCYDDHLKYNIGIIDTWRDIYIDLALLLCFRFILVMNLE